VGRDVLYLNDLIDHLESRNRFRIVHLDYANNDVWLFNLTGANCVPRLYPLDTVEAALVSREMSLVTNSGPAPIPKPSPAATAARDAAFSKIKPLTETSDILIPEKRNSLINGRARELGCSARTLIRLLRQWWAGGQTKDALLPRFHARGGTAGTTGNRGRPPIYEERGIYQMQAADKVHIEEILKARYLKSEAITLAACHLEMLIAEYWYVDSEGVERLKLDGDAPSIQQFRRVAKQLFPAEAVLRARKGDAEYELNHRAKLGSLQVETYTVGDCYEIDSTIADVFLVSSKNRGAIIGKPTLYLVVDRKSWLMVGFYIGLENSSWSAAMQAILSISEDKEALCQRHGIRYDPADWPAHMVFPKTFVADRGPEMQGESSAQIADGLNVTILNLPSKRADRKPHVECGFKLIHQPIRSEVPGYEPPANVAKRQGKHYERDACLTLEEFTKIILASIIRFNRIPRDGYVLSAEQVLDGFQPNPVDIWNAEIRRRAGALSRYSEERVRFSLLPKDEASVTRDGICLNDCYYSCPEAQARGWFDIAARSAFKVAVSYDKRLVDNIYIHDDRNPGGFFTATLLDKCADYRGLSVTEVAAIEFRREQIRKKGVPTTRQETFELHKVVKPMATTALGETRVASKGKSRSARKKDIVEDRAEELRSERQRKPLIPSVTPRAQPAEVIPLHTGRPAMSDGSSPALPDKSALRLQKYEEMLNGL